MTTLKKQPRYSQTRKKRTFFSPMPTRSWGVLPIRNANLPQRGSLAVLRSAEERQCRALKSDSAENHSWRCDRLCKNAAASTVTTG